MPQTFTVEGAGVLEFPDDANPEEIQQFLDENYNTPHPSALRSALGHAAANVGPGAAFMAAAGPGATYGAMAGAAIPVLGETGIGEIGGGIIGGLVTGTIASIAAAKAQKAALRAVAPQFAQKAEEELAAGEKEHPWASAAGDVAAMGASARMAPFKLAQIPFRAALGAGMGVAMPAIQEHRLPTAPELVSGVAMGTLFGEARFSKSGAARPPASPEVRAEREQALKEKAPRWTITDEPLARPGDVANTDPDTGKVTVNRKNLHEYLEQDLPKDVTPEHAINDLINHEEVHGATAMEQAKEFWDNLSPYEQQLEKRRIHGPLYRGKPLTDEQYGAESIRFWTQLIREKSATEFISSVKAENRTAKFLSGLQKVVRWTRENMGSEASKEAIKRNNEILDTVNGRLEAVKQELKKGAPDALESKATPAVRAVRDQPVEGAGQVPAEKAGPKDDEGRRQAGVAQAAQVPLSEVVGTKEGKNMPVWVREAMTRAGLDPNRPLNDIDLADTKIREAVQNDPTLTKKQKNQILKTGSAKAAPAAQPGEPQPAQAQTGLATTPPAALTAGGPAATPDISAAFPAVKMEELDALNRKITAPGYRPSKAEYERWVQLTEELDKAEAAAGVGPAPQGGEPMAMSRKPLSEDSKKKFEGLPPPAKKSSVPIVLRGPEGSEIPGYFEGWGQGVNAAGTGLEMQPWVSRLTEGGWSTGLLHKGEQIAEGEITPPPAEALAMSRKTRTPEEEVAARLISSIGGIHDDLAKRALVKENYDRIVALPKEQWGPELTKFHQEWKTKEIQDAAKKMEAQDQPTPIEIAAKAIGLTGQDLTEALSPANIAKQFGAADRALTYRSAIATLNSKSKPITPTETEGPVKPRYDVGDYKEFWTDLQEHHPEIPEQAARDVWNEAVHDVLNNASGERIKELLRPARLEKRFLGEGLLRHMPDANPHPILEDMAKWKNPTDSPAFKRFCAVRDLTPEEGKALIEQLRDMEMAERLAAREGPPPPKPGEGVAREPRTEAEKAEAERLWKEGFVIGQRRRRGAIRELSKWYNQQAVAPERSPNRKTIGLDDVWFEVKGKDVHAYAEYTTKQGEDAKFLRSVLGKGGSIKGKTATTTRSIAIVVDPKTGVHHAVSVYVRHGEPMIYNPDVYAGSKAGNHITIPQLLANYRVNATLLVKDPVYNFHQQWPNEKTYVEAIGGVAKIREQGSTAQWMAYIKEAEAEREAEKKRQHEERYFGKVTEEELAGEEAAEPEKTEEGETEEEPSISEQMAKTREERETRAWAESEEPEIPSKKVGKWDKAALEVWLRGGPGSDVLGLFQSDLSHLARESLAGSEAESLYELSNEYKVSHPLDFQKMLDAIQAKREKSGVLNGREISALYAMDKIANRIYERMLNSPTEQAKLAKLPPIPKDTEYVDMNPGEKAHYLERESLKYRALLKTFNEVYEIANEARTAQGGKGAPVEKLAVPPDTEAFRTRALDRYGDTSRRNLELAAVSAQRAAREKSISGERSLLAGSKFGGTPRTAIGRRLATYQQKLPRPPGQGPEMLPSGYPRQEPYPPPRGAFPFPPVTPSDIGGAGFTGKKPEKIPERGTPVGFGQERGFVPSQTPPSDITLRQMYQRMEAKRKGEPLPMTRKGYGVAERYQDEMRAQGRLTYQKPEEALLPKEVLIARGRDDVLSGKINPMKEMIQAKRTGYISERSTPAFRYWGYRLQQIADEVAAQSGVQSKAYKEAESRSSEWQKLIGQTSKKMFERTGKALQGWNQIGPDDMKSTTFVRNAAKAAKARRLGRAVEDIDLDESEEAEVASIVGRSKASEEVRRLTEMAVGEEASRGVDEPLDEGNKRVMSIAEKQSDLAEQGSASSLKSKKPKSSAMAMKGEEGKLPPLDPETEDELGNIGMRVMQKLSKANKMTDANWLEAMKKRLRDPDIERPDLEPYLEHVRAVSEKINETFINNYVGTGSAVKDARKMFTRKKPPIEVSIAAIRRAMEADPSGRHPSPAEAYHIWNYLKQRFFDQGVLDFREIRTKASAELGIKDATGNITNPYTQLRLFRAMSTNRTMRELTQDLVKRVRDEARIKGQAMNWLKNQQYPGWLRAARFLPRFFFWDKIVGHGLVPMVTHASNMMFNPRAWSEYFGHWQGGKWKPGAWQEMYRMQFGTLGEGRIKGADYHKLMMDELVGHERFEFWKTAGLEADPFKYTDDYQIEALQYLFGDKMSGWLQGRGFDALKTLRYAMAEKWLNSLPEHLRNQESARLIADSVNHATGIVKTQFHESLNWLMFAPKLEASRWAYVFKDTAKAANYIAHWKTASLEQRAWAKSEMQQKAMVVGFYAMALYANQSFLKMAGSNQEINFTDPKKADFLAFKVAGFKVGVMNPFVGMIRMFANALHTAFGERTKFERLTSRTKSLMEVAGQYARGKMSPLSSFATDIASAQDYAGRPLGFMPQSEPLSRSKRLQGIEPYGVGEYAAEALTPIPIEEGVKRIFMSQGMSEADASKWVRTLIIAGGMSATGARVSEDQ